MTALFRPGDRYQCPFTVSEEVYAGFRAVFRDLNPLHTDPAFARAAGFGGEVMYGNILNGFLSCFIGMKLPTQRVIIHSQDISYRRPVYLNDRLTLEAVVAEVHESVRAVAFKYTFRNQDAATVAKGRFQIGIL